MVKLAVMIDLIDDHATHSQRSQSARFLDDYAFFFGAAQYAAALAVRAKWE
jgi:hypothetical protein